MAFRHHPHSLSRRRLALAACVACAFVLGGAERAAAQAPVDPPFVRHELIVRLRSEATGAEFANLFAQLRAIGIQGFQTEGLYVLRLSEGMDVPSAKAIAAQLEGVAYAEPNFIVSIGTTLPNDPSFGDLWGLHNTGQSGGTVDADIDAPEAWDITTGSADVVVAVLDTGLDYTHPDLVANMFRNETDCNTDGIDNDVNGYVDDCHGIDTLNNDTNPMDDHNHGTHTAGTIGASGNNGAGVTGVNWQVKLLPCKFLGSDGSGPTSNAITCLEYIGAMKDRGVNIVATNNSWSGGAYSQTLYDAIQQQRQRGILFIAAAGNATNNNDINPAYPSSYDLPNVIGVANTTRNDGQAGNSSYGRRSIHLGAPGTSIFSTIRNGLYQFMSGTSMATPHVAGVAALLEAQDPSRDWRAIKNLILAGGDSIAAMGTSTITGKRLNAYGALACNGASAFSRVTPIANTVTTSVGTGVALRVLNITCAAGAGNVTVTVSGGGTVTLVDDGIVPDQVAGDGVYAGTFTPATIGARILTFPDTSTLTVHVLSATSYTVQSTTYNYRQITGTSLSLGDDTSAMIASPFPVSFGGNTFSSLFVSSNGTINVSAVNNAFDNAPLPTTTAGSLIAPFWDDLYSGLSPISNVFWAVTGATPNRELVVEWRNVTGFNPILPFGACPNTEAVTFQVVFLEGRSDLLFNYADATFGGNCTQRNGGALATIGVQSSSSVAHQHSHNTASVSDGTALLWTLPGSPGSPFTDDPIAVGIAVRAVHFTELRARIDAQRLRFALTGAAWTDPSLVAGVTTVRVEHLLEMRTALSQAYAAAGLTPPTYQQSNVQAQFSVVTAQQIAELRAATLALEAQ
jgi:subtilisin family serine protease